MVAIARKYKSDAGTLTVARQIITGCGIKDVRAQKIQTITCIQNWVRDNIIYVPDPRDTELLQTPPQTLSIGTGDCDDKSILVATLLETLGFTTRYVAVGGSGPGWAGDEDESSESNVIAQWQDWNDQNPPPYSHVLAQVQYAGAPYSRLWGGKWLCLETIVAGKGPGWCPPGVQVLMPAHI